MNEHVNNKSGSFIKTVEKSVEVFGKSEKTAYFQNTSTLMSEWPEHNYISAFYIYKRWNINSKIKVELNKSL